MEDNTTDTPSLQPQLHGRQYTTIAINKKAGWLIGGLLLVILSFLAGMQFEKVRSPHTGLAANRVAGGFGGYGRGFARRGGGIGTVTAVSSSSITINNRRSGSAQTFAINSNTRVTNNGASASASDIKSGDTVLIRTSGNGSTTATAIDINPSFNGASTSTPDGQPSASPPDATNSNI